VRALLAGWAGGKPAAAARPRLEALEDRLVPSGYTPTGVEQEFLERLNDARANPTAYGQSVGVDLSGIAPSQPLAFNTALIQSSRDHSIDMNVNNFFGHNGSDGSTPFQRMSADGFPWVGAAESIAAGQPNVEAALQALIVDAGVADLGHRKQLLSFGGAPYTSEQQTGVGVVLGGSGSYHNYYTIDSGNTADTHPIITGVVYNDVNKNGVYDAGEGLGGVTITVSGVGSITTWDSGGYSFEVSPGTYTVTASGGGLKSPITSTITVGSWNYRLNFVGGQAQPPVFEPIQDQTVAAGSSVTVSMSATDPNGLPITFSATSVTLAYALKQQYGWFFSGNNYFNYGGKQDKWFQGAGGAWFFILPSGALYKWDGTANQATGTLIATFDASYYANPALLYNASSAAPASTTVVGNQLTVKPNAGFTGVIVVTATASDGLASSSQSFKVTVTGNVNQPPVLNQPSNASIAKGTSYTTTLSATDPDGDAITYSAVVASQAYQLRQQYGWFFGGSDYYNWGGKNEKWFQGAGGAWFFILPSGALYKWDGSGQATGTLIATMQTAYYANISLLYNATPGATVSLNGNVLTVTPDATFVGVLTVTATASDGSLSDSKSFTVTVS
jgi:uncharacterized protein YkwD